MSECVLTFLFKYITPNRNSKIKIARKHSLPKNKQVLLHATPTPTTSLTQFQFQYILTPTRAYFLPSPIPVPFRRVPWARRCLRTVPVSARASGTYRRAAWRACSSTWHRRRSATSPASTARSAAPHRRTPSGRPSCRATTRICSISFRRSATAASRKRTSSRSSPDPYPSTTVIRWVLLFRSVIICFFFFFFRIFRVFGNLGFLLMVARVLQEVWLDRVTGKVCMSISAKAMTINGIDDRRYWNWIPTEESRLDLL